DLLVGEAVAERGHHAVEAACGPAIVRYGEPVGVGLAGGEAAIREVRHGDVEAEFHGRSSGTVLAVAARACVQVHRGIVLYGGRVRLRVRERRGRRGEQDDCGHTLRDVALTHRTRGEGSAQSARGPFRVADSMARAAVSANLYRSTG